MTHWVGGGSGSGASCLMMSILLRMLSGFIELPSYAQSVAIARPCAPLADTNQATAHRHPPPAPRQKSCACCRRCARGWGCTPPPPASPGCGSCRYYRGITPAGTASQTCLAACPSTRWGPHSPWGHICLRRLACLPALLLPCPTPLKAWPSFTHASSPLSLSPSFLPVAGDARLPCLLLEVCAPPQPRQRLPGRAL
jgi:hypothetical protein